MVVTIPRGVPSLTPSPTCLPRSSVPHPVPHQARPRLHLRAIAHFLDSVDHVVRAWDGVHLEVGRVRHRDVGAGDAFDLRGYGADMGRIWGGYGADLGRIWGGGARARRGS